MKVAREVRVLFLVATLGAWLAYQFCGLYCALPFIAIALVIPYVFRDPQCHIPPVPLAVVSPVYGRVSVIEDVIDPYLGREALRIVIRMPILGPYVLRSPIEGRVMQQWHLPNGLDSQLMNNVDANVLMRYPNARQGRYAIWIQTDEQDDVVVVLRGALITRRLQCIVHVGERIGQGKRCGLIQFPATVEVFMPINSRKDVMQGDSVRAGSAIIANLIHKSAEAAVMVSETSV